MTSRRSFLKTSALATGALLSRTDFAFAETTATAAPLNILILGGTGFIGPHLVRHAIARGHHVTIFTRGRRDGNLPPSVTRLTGDRNGQLGALAGKKWDAVIDDSATNPEWVRMSTDALKDSGGRYLFTSSTGVYYPYLTRGADESVAVHDAMIDAKDEDEIYGVSKVRCEHEVMRVFGNRGLVVRPTYIVGPGDNSDRFTYWVVRITQPGEILAPGRREDSVQWIDVRDLVAFYIKLVEDGRTGIYNGVGASATIPSRTFYDTLRTTLNPKATFAFVDDYALLTKHKLVEIVPWVIPQGNLLHATTIASTKSAAAGLKIRPLVETLRDTAAWWPTEPEAHRMKPRFPIAPAVEAAALAEWHARSK